MYIRESLAEDATVSPEGSGFNGFTLSHNVESESEVDQIIKCSVEDGNIIYNKSIISFYSVLSGQGIMHFGFAGFMPTSSFSLEYNLSEKIQVKMGLWGLMMLSGDNSGDKGIMPFIGLNWRF